MKSENLNLSFRTGIIETDPATVEEIVRSTGYFYEYEIPIARELAEERLVKGKESGYYFIFAMIEGKTVAYSCYGPIACTNGSFDLYWIVTHQDWRAKSIGKKLLDETLKEVKQLNGRMLIAETSTKQQYLPTRKFYENNGFLLEAIIVDFYEVGDGKAMYVKRFE